MNIPKLSAYTDFSPESRVWVYMTDRPLSDAEEQAAQTSLNSFVRQWTAHNQALKAAAEIFEKQFVILMVDETQAGASGCSIDKSVHFLESLGAQLNVNFFDRMRFSWLEKDGLQFADRDTLRMQVQNAQITDSTLMVNTMVLTQKELREKWLLPFGQSWHRRLV